MDDLPTIERVESLELDDFTAFEEASIECSEDLNVFIGENATGKTHAMKAMYALLRGVHADPDENGRNKEEWRREIADRLVGVFQPDSLGRLTNRGQGRTSAEVKLGYRQSGTNPHRVCDVRFATNASKMVKFERSTPDPAEASTVFIPAREVLSIFPGFLSAYRKRELNFDETFYDLCFALDANPLKPGARRTEIDEVVEEFEEALDVDVRMEDGEFYVRENRRGADLEASLVAEGLRKLVTVLFLVLNGTITDSSVVFWDEPEANLNPQYSAIVADLLTKLADSGVQVFVASHDYVLTKKLSLYAEYPEAETGSPDIRFFGFRFDDRNAVTVDRAATLAELPENPILEQFDELYDQEMELFERAGE